MPISSSPTPILSCNKPETRRSSHASISSVHASETPSTNFFDPGNVYKGKQYSGKSAYGVELEILNTLTPVNFEGYLHIDNLTPDFPRLSTCFTAEIITRLPGIPFQVAFQDGKLCYDPLTDNPQDEFNLYGFKTGKWEASREVDEQHWGLFANFLPELEQLHKNCNIDGVYDYVNSDFIFFRLKEEFIVPNHKIASVTGASFSGFYYCCYVKKEKKIIGYYYHKNSELFQRMDVALTRPGMLSGAWEFN